MAGRRGVEAAASKRLLAWYAREARDLPWRRRPTPYRTWVSEIMLQQTTVPVAAPYFRRFVSRFPGAASLARAREQEVLALWSGLGYYRRARNLLAAAREIVRRHGGRVPSSIEDLRALPGIGEYTAGAIRSIGFNLPAVALEANGIRVLARFGAVRGDLGAARARRRLACLAAALMPSQSPSAFNQALMDLGSAICTPREPRCDACPIARWCGARAAGLTATIPTQKKQSAAIRVSMDALAVVREAPSRPGRTECMLVRRGRGPLMQGLWEFPLSVNGGAARTRAKLETGDRARGGAGQLAARYGAKVVGRAGEVPHTITRHRIRINVYAGRLPGKKKRGVLRARWVGLEALALGRDGVASSGGARKIAKLLCAAGSSLVETHHARR